MAGWNATQKRSADRSRSRDACAEGLRRIQSELTNQPKGNGDWLLARVYSARDSVSELTNQPKGNGDPASGVIW